MAFLAMPLAHYGYADAELCCSLVELLIDTYWLFLVQPVPLDIKISLPLHSNSGSQEYPSGTAAISVRKAFQSMQL